MKDNDSDSDSTPRLTKRYNNTIYDNSEEVHDDNTIRENNHRRKKTNRQTYNIDGSKVEPVIMTFELINNGDQPIDVTLTLNQINTDELINVKKKHKYNPNINYYSPSNVITANNIKPGDRELLLIISKKDPLKDWGNIHYNVDLKNVNNMKYVNNYPDELRQ